MVDSTFQQNYQDLKRCLSAAVFVAGLAVSGIGLVTQRAAQILGDSTEENYSWGLIGLGAVIMIATSVATVVTEINLRKARKAEELAQHQRELEAAGRRARGEMTFEELTEAVRSLFEQEITVGVSTLAGDLVSVECVVSRLALSDPARRLSILTFIVTHTQQEIWDETEPDVLLLTDDGRDS